MPGLVPGIHVFLLGGKDVDGRVKPGHDGIWFYSKCQSLISVTRSMKVRTLADSSRDVG